MDDVEIIAETEELVSRYREVLYDNLLVNGPLNQMEVLRNVKAGTWVLSLDVPNGRVGTPWTLARDVAGARGQKSQL